MSKRKGYMRITKRMKSKNGNCYIGAVNDGFKEFEYVRETTKISKNRDNK